MREIRPSGLEGGVAHCAIPTPIIIPRAPPPNKIKDLSNPAWIKLKGLLFVPLGIVHAYELEHGKPPTASSELVPQYLKSVPLDPETSLELPLN